MGPVKGRLTVLPNLFLAGAPKSGTTSLFRYLEQHEEIFRCRSKEPMYFIDNERYPRSIDWYGSLFEEGRAATIRGDASIRYGACPYVCERIRKVVPSPKFIFLLRNPIWRTWSHFRWAQALGFETRPIQTAYMNGPDIDATYSGERLGLYTNYLQESHYSEYIRTYIDAFGGDNVLVITSEVLESEPGKVLQECTDFLKVPRFGNLSPIRTNVTPRDEYGRLYAVLTGTSHSDPRVRKLQTVLGPVSSLGRRSRWLRKRVRSAVMKRLGGWPEESLSSDDYEFLRRELAEEVERLRGLLETPFEEWDEDFPRF
jgi:hypothetical protein